MFTNRYEILLHDQPSKTDVDHLNSMKRVDFENKQFGYVERFCAVLGEQKSTFCNPNANSTGNYDSWYVISIPFEIRSFRRNQCSGVPVVINVPVDRN